MKTLLVMAGGTGGHVIPALSVAKELRARGVRIIWMGTRSGIEAELVPQAGFELKTINVSGLRATGFLRKLTAPLVLSSAAIQAMMVIISSRVNALLGMGGFASGPGGWVGWMLKKPLLIHEQNAIAGTTNKLLAGKAEHRLSGFSSSKGIADSRHIGNPLKPEFAAIPRPSERLVGRDGLLRILVVGGSSGAQVFNQLLPDFLAQLQSTVALDIRHQAGKGREQAVSNAYRSQQVPAKVSEFIQDMADAFSWADLIICRSGAMTVSEVSAAGAAALFVPFPYAIDDHQWHNAQELAQDGSAICLRQVEFETGKWISTVEALAADRLQLIKMAEQARSHAKLNATADVADICMEVLDA